MKKIESILNDRIKFLSFHNEEGKETRINEIKILKGIFRDKIAEAKK